MYVQRIIKKGKEFMAKIDMHVHSKYSKHPSEWFLQRIGAAESYTEPGLIYARSKENGMNFITITDHNSIEGALLLKAQFPEEIIVGMEATTYFPEDGCKIHILIFGLNEEQGIEINRIRENIYELRNYIRNENLAYSIAHANYSVNGKLTGEHLEKLILLFDIFEVQNGARNKRMNIDWSGLLTSLTEADILELHRKHNIEPFGKESWIKGFTGGSDDHAGLFIGKTYTCADADSIEEFLAQLKMKKTLPGGRHNNFQGLVFAIYKIAYDFSKTKSKSLTNNSFSRLTEFVFEKKDFDLKGKFFFKRLIKKKKQILPYMMLDDLIKSLRFNNFSNIDDTFTLVYDKLAKISDYFIKFCIESIKKDLTKGNIVSLARDFSISLPGIFLSIPFLTAFKHLFNNRNLVNGLSESLGKEIRINDKKILWFTDTLTDLNGVSIVLKKIAQQSMLRGKNMKIITSLHEEEKLDSLPPNTVSFEPVYSFNMPYYENLLIRIPSLLHIMQEVYKYDPDEIYISTPGPMGLAGLLISKMLGVKSISVFHTDFTMQAVRLTKDADTSAMVENFLRWFYNSTDEIRVPTVEYSSILEKRGYIKSKMGVFRRGFDSGSFKPRPHKSRYFKAVYSLKKGVNLLYSGRISLDKNLDILVEAYQKAVKKCKDLNLILVGDGPYYDELKKRLSGDDRILMTGRLPHEMLPEVYSDSDIFVFPSTTDTFGMAVLEAQACGIPAVVSDIGGPREIIEEGVTGYTARFNDKKDWVLKIEKLYDFIKNKPKVYGEMCLAAWIRMIENHSWDNMLKDIYDRRAEGKKRNISSGKAYNKVKPLLQHSL